MIEFGEQPSDLTEAEAVAKQLEALGASDAARVVRRLAYRLRTGQHAPAVHYVTDLDAKTPTPCGKMRGSIELTTQTNYVTCRNCQRVLNWKAAG